MHILIIRPGAIGDTLVTFPVIQALRTHYADSYITLVGNAAVLPLALAFRLVEEVSDYGQMQWSELFSTAGIQSRTLREQLQGIDFAICWLRDADGLVERNLRLAGVKRIVVAVGRPADGTRIHVVEYLAGTAGVRLQQGEDCLHYFLHVAAGDASVPTLHPPHSRPYETPWQFIPFPKIPTGESPPAGASSNIDGYQQRIGRDSSGPYDEYVAIHPGSGGALKCWPVPSFVAVVEHLWRRNCAVLLLGGPADHQRLKQMQNLLAAPPKADMLKVLIDAPLLEVAHHVQQCSRYLGNDSGITHLAAMLGIPTVVLFGPTDPATWRPVGAAVEVMHEPVLEQLDVERVLEKLL